MRLLFKDAATGRIRVRLETPSDLWRVARLVRPGDRVGASTTRRDPEVPEDTPGAQRSRRRIFLMVRAEASEFHGFSRHVRVTGPILEGPFDLGRHHTLDLTEGDDVTIEKDRWNAADQILLEEGTRRIAEPVLLVATVDWGESFVARLRGRSVEPVADLRRSLAGKRSPGGQGEKDRTSYAEELVGVIAREAGSATSIVVAGPGFLKEEVVRRLAEADPKIRSKLTLLSAAESGRAGLDELLRSGAAQAALAGSLAAEESSAVEALLAALATGRRAAVGRREVEEATTAGAVESALISESLLPDPAVGAMLDRLRQDRAKLLIVRDEGDPGKRLLGLGGIAAILRYDWVPTSRLSGSRP